MSGAARAALGETIRTKSSWLRVAEPDFVREWRRRESNPRKIPPVASDDACPACHVYLGQRCPVRRLRPSALRSWHSRLSWFAEGRRRMPTRSKVSLRLCVEDRAGRDRIFVMNSAGNGQRPLTRLGADDSGPAWSPDRNRIAFITGDSLAVMNRNGSNRRILVRSTVWGADNPSWSPDGRRIAFENGPHSRSMSSTRTGQGTACFAATRSARTGHPMGQRSRS